MTMTVKCSLFCLQVFTSKSFIVDKNNGFRRGFLVLLLILCRHDIHHIIHTLPVVMDIICFGIGRYVIYYDERINGIKYQKGKSPHAFIDLCDVVVYAEF